jgi:hypothetical protein
MSETKTAPTTPEPEVEVETKPEINKDEIITNSPFNVPFVISRNGITVTASVFVGTPRAKSKWSGVPWVAPQIGTVEFTLEDKGYNHDVKFHHGITFIGRTNVVNALNIILRRYGQDFLDDSRDSITGELNLEAYRKAWSDLATSALKISELEELLDEEYKKQEKSVESLMQAVEDFSTGKISAETFNAVKNEINGRRETINSYRQHINARKKKPSQEKQADTVAPV